MLTGVAGIRLTAQSVSDLWGDEERLGADVSRAQLEVSVMTERVTDWFAAMAQAMTGAGTVPRALPRADPSDHRLTDALREAVASVTAADTSVRGHTVRLIWTADHVDSARRIQEFVEEPARTAAG